MSGTASASSTKSVRRAWRAASRSKYGSTSRATWRSSRPRIRSRRRISRRRQAPPARCWRCARTRTGCSATLPASSPIARRPALSWRRGRCARATRSTWTSAGSKGVRMQHYAENLFNFRVVVVGEDLRPRDYGGDAFLKVVGGTRVQAARLRARLRGGRRAVQRRGHPERRLGIAGLEPSRPEPGVRRPAAGRFAVRVRSRAPALCRSQRRGNPDGRVPSRSALGGRLAARHEQSDPRREASQASRLLRRPAPAHLPARRPRHLRGAVPCTPAATACSISAP